MVISSVLASGFLNQSNSVLVNIEDPKCDLNFGVWRFRIDSLAVGATKKYETILEVSCSLLTNNQIVILTEDTDNPNKKIKRTVPQDLPSPLHVLALSIREKQVKQLISPCAGDWRQFTNGRKSFQLFFRDKQSANDLPLELHIYAVLLFERVDPPGPRTST